VNLECNPYFVWWGSGGGELEGAGGGKWRGMKRGSRGSRGAGRAGARRRLLLLAAAAGSWGGGWAQEAPPPPAAPAPAPPPAQNISRPEYWPADSNAETQLKARLLEGYDRTTYPFSQMWEAKGEEGDNRTGLEVKVGINFHRVLSVSEVSSEVELMVWLRQTWIDPRLSWNATEAGVEKLYFFVDSGFGASEASQIWGPPPPPPPPLLPLPPPKPPPPSADMPPMLSMTQDPRHRAVEHGRIRTELLHEHSRQREAKRRGVLVKAGASAVRPSPITPSPSSRP